MFSVQGQLLLVSLVLCFVNLFYTLVIAFLNHLSGSFKSLANALEKMYRHMFTKCVLLVYLYIYLLELYTTPLRKFYWHRTFRAFPCNGF